jgi:hypothetical protein
MKDLLEQGCSEAVPPTLPSFHAYWTWTYEYFYIIVNSSTCKLIELKIERFV